MPDCPSKRSESATFEGVSANGGEKDNSSEHADALTRVQDNVTKKAFFNLGNFCTFSRILARFSVVIAPQNG
ncbi:hypothetical protein A6U84_25645 (plasmid) [Agrobacterium sp. 13-2099-1-2]|uniref:hypothetical protein n=1 Tax=Agrobacterium sp. 13-2099-1-2 TaxID=1841651 RepID=UPI0008100658|nr:hypothetical protein [Agrobacterium sp. 13-2099-1-2]UZX45528.1 hypothetical protein A6U84_25645 [Agrobacterium sp. 13-2099-1-2]